MTYAPSRRKGLRVYRFFALVFMFAAAACGGGDAPPNGAFGGKPTNTATPSQQVLGARNDPSLTPTAQPTVRPSEYTVVDGDTLSEIADKLGTTVDALVLANALADADSLTVGQVLKVPAAAAATATPSGSATATATTTQ